MNSGQRRPGTAPDAYSRAADPSGPRPDGSPYVPAPGSRRRAGASALAEGGRAERRRGLRSAERGRRLARWTGITAALALVAAAAARTSRSSTSTPTSPRWTCTSAPSPSGRTPSRARSTSW
ncbi:hypothetical protein ACFQ1I_18425 [Kitasatospora arboriphila]